MFRSGAVRWSLSTGITISTSICSRPASPPPRRRQPRSRSAGRASASVRSVSRPRTATCSRRRLRLCSTPTPTGSLASGPHECVLPHRPRFTAVDTLGVEAISDFAADGLLVFDYDNDGRPDLRLEPGRRAPLPRERRGSFRVRGTSGPPAWGRFHQPISATSIMTATAPCS